MSDDASDLLAASGGGREGHEGFARIFDRHGPVVLALCRHALAGLGSSAADDAVQETFIRAYRLLPRLDRAERLRPWLYGIARNVCAETRRSARRRRHYEEAAAVNHTVSLQPNIVLPPPEMLARAEALDRLGEALSGLTDEQRLAVHLYYLDADPVRAAREALGLSRSGFYKLLARAREHLAAAVKEVQA